MSLPLPMLVMAAAPFLGSLIGLLIGLRVDQRFTRKLALGSLLIVAAWIALMSALPHPRYPDPNGAIVSNIQWYGGSFVWVFIYAACGFSGPAFFRSRSAAIVTSILVTIAMATIGTVALIFAACAFGHDCL